MDTGTDTGIGTGLRTRATKTLVTGALVFATLVAGPSLGWAQQSSHLDPRWQGWIGCWQPVAPQSSDMMSSVAPRNAKAPLVCMVPAAAAQSSSGVDVVTVADGKVVARERIDATGQPLGRTRDGCTGTESARWSADGRRVFMRSDYTCPGALRRTSTGVFAISPSGEWVDVQGVSTQGGKGVRTLRYRDAGIPSTVPAEIASALRDRSLAVSAARIAASAPLTTVDVVEASHQLDPAVTEAWLVDRGQKFSVDAKQLVALADAGVPSNVTDAMVALSYPKTFAVDSSLHAGDLGSLDGTRAVSATPAYGTTGRNIQVYMQPSSPYGYSTYGYSPYGYLPYGYSPYAAYGAAYGLSYGGWYWNRSPTVIVLKGDQQPQRSGYVVKGHGYTQSDPGAVGSTAHPRPVYNPPASSSNGTEGRSSGSGSTSSGSGRTAKPRP